MDALSLAWSTLLDKLASSMVGPAVGALHLDGVVEDPREIAEYFALSAIQIVAIAGVMRPLEGLIPVERWPDRRGTGIDRAYMLIKLFLLVPLLAFVVIPAALRWIGWDADGEAPLQLERLVPVLRDQPFWAFLAYFTIQDFTLYVVHRFQHAVPWWWAVHSLHHSQRKVNCWTNDRDHYLDDLLEVLALGLVAALLGVAPLQYAAVVLLGQLVECFSHANVRIAFGPWLDKLIVDPAYHRRHHMRADASRPGLHDCNFALVFPVWDILFGTALYREPPRPCGVEDPAIDADNERGLVGQQLEGLRRFYRALRG